MQQKLAQLYIHISANKSTPNRPGGERLRAEACCYLSYDLMSALQKSDRLLWFKAIAVR